MKEYEEFINDEFNEEESCDEEFKDEKLKLNYDNSNNIDILKKFEVYFFIKLDNKENFIFPIESDLLNINKQCISDLIKNIVKKINDNSFIVHYNSMEYLLSLKECENYYDDNNFYINNYELRPCKKKTLLPKFDLPPFFANSPLLNIINEKISFITKNPLNIMLINKFQEYDENQFINKKIDKKEDKVKKKTIKIFNINIKLEKCNNCCIRKCIIF